MAIRNGSKCTISASGELGLLQMVLELDIGRCANEDANPQGVGEGNETFCVKVWKLSLVDMF